MTGGGSRHFPPLTGAKGPFLGRRRGYYYKNNRRGSVSRKDLRRTTHFPRMEVDLFREVGKGSGFSKAVFQLCRFLRLLKQDTGALRLRWSGFLRAFPRGVRQTDRAARLARCLYLRRFEIDSASMACLFVVFLSAAYRLDLRMHILCSQFWNS